ncbi:MAG: hypothetical protein ACLQPV_09400 [Vulcanimicrobiaceae bacterium]
MSRVHADAQIQWGEPLDPRSLARVAAWMAARPAATLRLHGSAVLQLPLLGDALPETVALEARMLGPMTAVRATGVRRLDLEGLPGDLAAVLDAFPNVSGLRLAARGEILAPDALTGRPIRVLDLSRLDIGPGPRAFEGLAGLRALRLYRLTGFKSLAGIERHGELRELALSGLLDVDDLEPLSRLSALSALELTGMWQLGLPAVEVLNRLSGLEALRIDIGGRRKNVEVYRRLPLRKPGPFGRSGFEAA